MTGSVTEVRPTGGRGGLSHGYWPIDTAWRLARRVAIAGAVVMALAPGVQGEEATVAPLAEKLIPAVVNISTTQILKSPEGAPLPGVPEGSPFDEFFKEFFDRREPGPEERASSLGSGFVIDPSGLIVTNNHVIADADEITVSFQDGSTLKVDKVIGRDAKIDVALLKVTPKKPLVAVGFGDSSKLRVGDWVMAIGNPFGYSGTVTLGIVSGKNRNINAGPYDEFIQTDASINKGNSGGPLFNMQGEVIGINTAIYAPSGTSIGLGFAIPSNIVAATIAELKEFGEPRRGWMGASLQTLTPEIAQSLGLPSTGGAMVAIVSKGGPADRAGIQVGDVIVRFDGQTVQQMRNLPHMVALTQAGKTVRVEVLRDGKPMSFELTLDRMTESAEVASNAVDAPSGDGDDDASEEVLVLGLTLVPLTPDQRSRFHIAGDVEGVLVSDVDPDGVGASKGIKVGEVISEVTSEKVVSPTDMARRIASIQDSGRKSALLLVVSPTGEIRFVAVPLGAP